MNDLAIEARIDDLLASMTLAEKVGQLNQEGSNRVSDEDLKAGRVGSILCASSAYAGNDRQHRVLAAEMNRLQRLCVEESRLGIPLLVGRDVIHGHRAVLPIPVGQAATWSPEWIEKGAECAAREAAADGLNWTFTPMLDIARDPRWGRIAEGYGEDPFLGAAMARAAVQGLQGDDLADPERILACAKHFLGYGAAEGGRDYNTTEISPSTLLNVYAPPFRAAVEAGVGSFMASFNEIGGVPVTSSREFLTDLLRTAWGFDGFVVSDWGAVAELVEHGVAEDRAAAAKLALEAGVDMDMVSRSYLEHLEVLVSSGAVDVSVVDEAVRRILRLKFRLGLFEHPYTDEGLAAKVHLRQDHLETAYELSVRSAVLLKNESVLPLAATGRIGLFGPMSEATGTLFGTWTLDGDAGDVRSILDCFRERLDDPRRLVHVGLVDDMVSAARHCDVVVAVVGESPGRSGEDNCVTSLELPPGQVAMLQALHALGKPMVVVVVAGRSLALGWVMEHADAVLFAFHPGIQGGAAIADLLLGRRAPSGRLPATFPRSTGQVPIYYNHKATGRPLGAGSKHSRYVDSLDSPLLPFGFGLGYTSFAYRDLAVTPEAPVGGAIEVRATVQNVGATAGAEVAQLYIRDRTASITRPVRELKGFRSVELEPGEAQEVVFVLGPKELGFYGNDGIYRVEAGQFDVWVGPNAAEGLHGEFVLTEAS